jgi:hypothetical protein
VLYPAAIHFKGSGFYSTDYGRGNRRPSSKDGDGAGDAGAPTKGDKAPRSRLNRRPPTRPRGLLSTGRAT